MAADRVLFVGDVHLRPERPEIAERFTRFLEDVVPGARAVYVLGDSHCALAWVQSDGWKAPDIRRDIQLSCDDKFRLRDNGVTLEAIAKELGITRERVRQIEVMALKKCRK